MKNNIETSSAHTPNALLNDLHNLIAEVEKLAETGGDVAGDTLEALRARFETAHERLGEICACTKKKIAAGVHCANETIRANPYQSLAIASGVALLIGFLLGRQHRHSAD